MNVEIVTEAALFPEKEYINVIFVAVPISLYPLLFHIFPHPIGCTQRQINGTKINVLHINQKF